MDRFKAALGSLLFLIIAPGTVAGLLPRWITGWEAHPAPSWWLFFRVLGGVLIAAGAVALLAEFARFAFEGIGTPAPIAPTRHLVVHGLYRYVRNPMYVAVVAIIVGQTLLLASAWLLVYAVAAAGTMASFVHWYEEPTLLARYGEEYRAYRDAVSAWIPVLPGHRADRPR